MSRHTRKFQLTIHASSLASAAALLNALDLPGVASDTVEVAILFGPVPSTRELITVVHGPTLSESSND